MIKVTIQRQDSEVVVDAAPRNVVIVATEVVQEDIPSVVIVTQLDVNVIEEKI